MDLLSLLLVRQLLTFLSAIFWLDTFLIAKRSAKRPWTFIYLSLTASTQFFLRLFVNIPGFSESLLYDLILTFSCILFLLAAYHMHRVWRVANPL